MKNLNNLITEFKSDRSDSSFESIYAEVTQAIIGSRDGNPYFRKIASSMKSDAHDVRAVFDDTLLNAITKFKADSGHDFIRYFKSSWRRRRANLYNKTKKVRENEVYEREIEGYESDFEDNNFASISDSITVEDKVFKTKEADQWKLIDFLVRGENERTTAIVQAFLSTELKTPTAIGKHLGLDHKQVSRALTRLQAKYSTKQFGDYAEYLIAL